MKLKGVAIKEFAPFCSQKCVFGEADPEGQHADVHIFVGENGTGKTRFLSLLLAACGNNQELVDRQTGAAGTLVAADAQNGAALLWTSDMTARTPLANVDHSMSQFLTSGTIAALGPTTTLLGTVSLPDAADRTPALAFMAVAAIRDDKVRPMAPVPWGPPPDFLVFSRPAADGASLCQAVSNMKIRAGMYMAGNPEGKFDRTVHLTERLEKTLGKITGRSFIFVVEQDGVDVRLKVSWGGVRMRLHQLPDGLRAIIGWLVSCVAKLDFLLPADEKPLERPVLLFLDEPETHLHPAWQRQILPALQLLLPNAQIFVTTHSPFVVSSVNYGWLYIFKASSDGTVQISKPQPCSKGDSYIDAVEDVLGVKEWYDPETESMLSRFRSLREKALRSSESLDKDAVFNLAREIAERSESLSVMMGHEIKQFESNLRLAIH